MSILQVNVRPAVGIRKSVNSRRGGELGRNSMNPSATPLTQQSALQQNEQQEQIELTSTSAMMHAVHDGELHPSPLSFSKEKPLSTLIATPHRAATDPAARVYPTTRHKGVIPSMNIDPAQAQAESIAELGAFTEPRTVHPPAAPPISVWQNVVWKLMPATTVGRALNSARERLNETDCPTASLDAQVILAHVLGVDRSWLFAHHEYKLNEAQADAFTDLIARRMQREPVAYLVGHREFYGLDFLVDQRVLIPRPETELLVDAVLDFGVLLNQERLAVADVGTGSGAIALSVANHCEHAHIYAIDLSLDALDVAKQNIARLDARRQVTLAHGDLLTPLPEKVNMIVANLPYISSDVYSVLDADVREYEPQLALEAGPEGLDAIQRLLQQANRYLHTNGAIFLEIGYDQGAAVKKLAATIFPNAQRISIRQDYHGHDRLVTILP